MAANPDVQVGIAGTLVDFEQNLMATRNLLEAMEWSHDGKLPAC